MQQSALLDILWAWLFGQGKSYKTYMMNGERVEQGMKQSDFRDICLTMLDPVIEQLSIAYDWDFIYDVGTETTVIDTSEYTLKGNNDDCRNIETVRYGPGRGTVLKQLDTLLTDRREGEETAGASDSGDVYGYTLEGESDDGFPKIQLFDTPAEAKTLTYRYRKNGVSINEFPAEFGFVVRDYMIAQFDPSYLAVADRSLKELIGRYDPGGDEIVKVRRDTVDENRNIYRNTLTGGC